MTTETSDLRTIIERLEKQNRNMRRLVLFLVVLLVFPMILFLAGVGRTDAAQKPQEIYMEGQTFTLGMPKKEALARLAECCNVNGDFITNKNGPPYRRLGAIHFENEKAKILVKNHGQYQDSETFGFATKLYRLISEIGKSGSVFLSVQITEGSNSDLRYIDIQFPTGRLLRVVIGRVDEGPVKEYVDITEELHTRE